MAYKMTGKKRKIERPCFTWHYYNNQKNSPENRKDPGAVGNIYIEMLGVHSEKTATPLTTGGIQYDGKERGKSLGAMGRHRTEQKVEMKKEILILFDTHGH